MDCSTVRDTRATNRHVPGDGGHHDGRWFKEVRSSLDFGHAAVYAPHILELCSTGRLRQLRHPFDVLAPTNAERRDARRYFMEEMYCRSLAGIYDEDAPAAAFLERLTGRDDGGFDFPDRGRVTVTPGIHRPAPLDRTAIAELVFLNQFESSAWRYMIAQPSLFPERVAPGIPAAAASDPVDWAVASLRIAQGYGAVLGGRDYAPLHTDDVYSRTAAVVANSRSDDESRKRTFDLTANRLDLLDYGFAFLHHSFTPEAAIFLLELSDSVDIPMLREPRAAELLDRFATYVENGLRVDRLVELFRYASGLDPDPLRALAHCGVMANAIYGGAERPWWFKEDFDLRSPGLGPLERAESLAVGAGPLFERVRPIVPDFESRIAHGAGVSAAESVSLVTSVVGWYGIGNEQRARRVLEYVCAILDESAPEERLENLRLARALLERERPQTPVCGVLEGGEATVHQPGLYPVVHSVASASGSEVNTDALSLAVEHLRSAATSLSLPLSRRSSLRPKLAGDGDLPLLLTAGSLSLERLSAEARTPGTTHRGPLVELLRFDARLRSESVGDPANLASGYFTLCATRMPEPFNPPPGFLALVERFMELPLAGYRRPEFEEPSEREYIQRENVRRRKAQLGLLTNLVELSALGVFSLDEVQRLVEWACEPTPALPAADEWDEPIDPEVPGPRIEAPRLAQLDAALRLLIPIAPAMNRDALSGAAVRNLFSVALARPFTKDEFHAFGGTSSTLPELDRLDELEKAGFLDAERLNGAVLAIRTVADLADFASDILHACAVFHGLKTRLDDLMGKYCRGSFDTGTFRRVLDYEREANEEGFAKHPFIASGSVSRMIEEWCWIDRYLDPLAELEAFRRRALPPRSSPYAFDEATCVADATNSLVAFWFLNSMLDAPYRPGRSENGGGSALLPANAVGGAAGPAPERAAAVEHRLPELRAALRRVRTEEFGLYPVGGKIHVLHPIDEHRFELLTNALGLGSTSFRLIHANRSLILPPMPTAAELAYLIRFLDAEGVVDWDHPELQIAIPGRLPPRDVAVLGSAILLSTEEGVEYRRDSFATTHNPETDYRITVYDAMGGRTPYPFVSTREGRTDILGRRHLADIRRFQILATVLGHAIDGGPFAELEATFREGYHGILESAGLSDILEAPWVRSPTDTPDTAMEHFDRGIRPCTDAWFACAAEFRKTGVIGGVVGQVQSLFDWLEDEVRGIRSELLVDPAYARERTLLVGEEPPARIAGDGAAE